MKLSLIATLLAAAVTGLTGSGPSAQPAPEPEPLKVATWNVRSGMGVRGFATTSWSGTSQNCIDKTKPLNAWGVGVPQPALRQLAADQRVVALAIQEAWGCGSPSQVNGVVGFKAASREQEGVALLARYGFAAPVAFHHIDRKHNRWLVGAPVCLDALCSVSLPMYSTHWGGANDDDFPVQAQMVLKILASHAGPHLFMGDLNVFQIDRWNPRVPCTAKDHPGRTNALRAIESAGYVDAWKATARGEGWTGMLNRRDCGIPEGSFYKRIDYVFAKDLRVMGATRFAVPSPGSDAASDHAGLLVELIAPK